MHEVQVIMRRELKGYFHSPIAYIFGALFLFTACFLGAVSLVKQGQIADLSLLFTWFPILFLFFLPALTMRLWAEERKLGTLELLLTYPVRISQLIAGKFLAALAFVALLLLLTLGLPLSLSMYGQLDWAPIAATYLACLFMAAAYLSVGMFWSSVTRDQLIALLLSVITLAGLYGLLGYLSALLTEVLPRSMDWLVLLVAGISPRHYFSSIARGVVDTGDLIYYLCFCAFFLYANAVVLNGRRVKG